ADALDDHGHALEGPAVAGKARGAGSLPQGGIDLGPLFAVQPRPATRARAPRAVAQTVPTPLTKPVVDALTTQAQSTGHDRLALADGEQPFGLLALCLPGTRLPSKTWLGLHAPYCILRRVS